MRALWVRMKMPPWLNILSTSTDVAGTQYMRLTKRCRHLNWSLLRMALTLAFGNAEIGSADTWVVLKNSSRPTLRDQGQDQQCQDQDQDRIKSVSSGLETKTTVSRTTVQDCRIVSAE